MRLALLLVAALAAAPQAAAQPVESCTHNDCALVLTRNGPIGLSPTLIRAADSVRVAGGGLVDAIYGPDVTPFVRSSPMAVRYAQTYEQTRAPRLITLLASAVLGNVLLVDGISDDGFLSRGSGYGVAAGAAVSFGAYMYSSLRGERAARQAVAAYNGSLPSRSAP